MSLGNPTYEAWYSLELARIDASIALEREDLDDEDRKTYTELATVLKLKATVLRKRWARGTKR